MIVSKRLRNDLWFAYFAVLVCWSLFAYSELGNLLSKGQLFACNINGRPYVSDFVQTYVGACLAQEAAHARVDIYDQEANTVANRKLVAPVVPELPFQFPYPPYFAAFIRPISHFGLVGAWLVWCGLGVVLLLVSLARLVSEKLTSRRSQAFMAAAVMGAFPTWVSFKLGQASFFLLLGLVCFWVLLRKRDFIGAGLASPLYLIKLQYAPMLFCIGLVVGRGQYLAGFAVAQLLMVVFCLISVGAENIFNYAKAIWPGELIHGRSGVDTHVMQNFRGLLTLVFGDDTYWIKAVSAVIMIIAVVVICWLWHKKKFDFEVLASISVLAMLISSLHVHVQDFLVAVIPCLWLWSFCTRQLSAGYEKAGQGRMSLSLLCSLVLLLPAFSWLFFIGQPFWQQIRVQPYFLWSLLVIVLAVQASKKQSSLTDG